MVFQRASGHVVSLSGSPHLTTRSSEQRLAFGFFLQSTSVLASLCR